MFELSVRLPGLAVRLCVFMLNFVDRTSLIIISPVSYLRKGYCYQYFEVVQDFGRLFDDSFIQPGIGV